MRCVTPMLRVPDVPAAIAWYGRLGFAVTSTDQDYRPGEPIAWCELQLEGAALMLRTGPGADRDGHGDVTLSFDVADAEAFFARIEGLAEVVYPPRVQPYGRVDFEVRDPAGYRLLFGSPRRGTTSLRR